MPAHLRLLGLALTLTLAACGSVTLKNDGGGDGAAGSPGSAGSTSSGGATGSAGSTSSGGATGSAGSTSSGGATGSAGSTSSGGATGSAGSTGTGGELPTKVTIKVTVPADHPYCDQTTGCTGPTHIQILSADGKPLTIVAPYCATSCTACTTPFCPVNAAAAAICPAPHGVMFTGTSLDWDGTIFKTSTCGANVSCSDRVAAPAGMYIARVCGTPGKLDNPDAGFQAKCVASGAEVCVDVPFKLPTATTVVGKLP